MERNVVASLATHPDDAEFCAGALALLAEPAGRCAPPG